MSPLVVIGFVALAVGIALTLLALTRSRVREGGPLVDGARAGNFYNLIATAFAVLLAFVVLVAFQSYNSAKAGAESEAVAAVELFNSAEFLLPVDRDAYESEMACYARAAVAEWPPMQDGERNPDVDLWVEAMRDTAVRFDLDSPVREAAFANLLTQESELAAGRRERLSEASAVVTTPVWIVLLLGGTVVVLTAFVFIDRRERFGVEAVLTAGVTIMVTSGLLLIYFLDHPYGTASGSILPVEMERTIEIMDAQSPELTLPCDEAGRPLGEAAGAS